ncbi:PIR Superfamily Protein [Plasmodium ovale wallikeri]|uniref:PIR Superfamily Protein n=1 Tax=Plasmodium ovale wallikeri TaxID=864142 RepID=A0A1A9AGD2_PLAOA|nr:PIR Superfamily Protein [Plasmodium ovale wallikeri]SBT55433.1 PIR Superfamily Protein [Plasmodium ovale wallikeri]
MGISKDELPSIKHYNVLKKCMHYNDIIGAIDKNNPTEADNWIDNFRTYALGYLEKYPNDASNNSNKRCRDLIYLIENIKTRITTSRIFYGENSYMIKNIDNYLQTILMPEGYDNCPMNSTNENTLYTENKKQLDDLCEDITYINEKLSEVNNSSQCKEIQDHFLGKKNSVMETDDTSSEYVNILKYHSYDTLDNIENIIDKIKCNNNHGAISNETPQSSGENTPILIVLPLLGIVLISFLLYKLTPLGPLLNTKIMKNTKYWKIINDKETDEILDHTSEIPQTYFHDKEYHMLYNTLEDS